MMKLHLHSVFSPVGDEITGDSKSNTSRLHIYIYKLHM